MVKKSSKEHPESLKEFKRIKPTDELREFVNKQKGDIEEERSQRTQWESAVDRLNKLRFGVRRKKFHPWPGAANFSIPQIDTDIQRLKPAYVNLAYAVNPIVTFEPYGPEDVESSRKREVLFDWRMRTQVDFFKPYNYGLDQLLGAAGMTVFRTIWKFSTRTFTVNLDINELDEETQEVLFDPRFTDEMLLQAIIEELSIDDSYEENIEEARKAVERFRDGDTNIELTLFETKDDQPEVTAIDVRDDLVVPVDTKNIQDARFIDYKFWATKNDIMISIRDGKYENFSDMDVDSWAGNGDIRKATIGANEDLVLLHETCAYYDVDGDGIDEKVIITWPDADPRAILRFIENPYDHGEWPYVQVKRELTKDGFYETRGIPSLVEDFQRGISTAVNQAIDNGTILNSPVTIGRKGIVSNPKNRRFIPGEYIETNGPTTDYEVRSIGNNTQGVLFQQAQFLKGWSDARLGQQTSGLGSSTDLPGVGDRGKKTAKEVETITALQSQAQSLDLQVFQQQMSRVYYQIDALYNQFGSDEEVVQVTGQEPVRITRDEVQGKFNIVPNGRAEDSTPQARLQRAMFAFNIGFQNPLVKQDQLTRKVFEELDPRMAANLLKTVEELQQEQQQAALAQQQQLEQQLMLQDAIENRGIEKNLRTKKVSDDLDIRKEALLVPISGKKFAPN